MQTQIKKIGNITWINIVHPEILEIKKLLTENSLNESLAEEIVNPTNRTKVDTLRNCVYLTLHFPFIKNEKREEDEIDFLIKSNLVITSSYIEIPFIKDFLEKTSVYSSTTSHGGNYFVQFINSIYERAEIEMDTINSNIKKIEENIFSSEERNTIENIAKVSKEIFDIKSRLKAHKDVLEIFSNEANKIFGFEFIPEAEELKNRLIKILLYLDNSKENLGELKDTVDFLLTNKTNQIVKVFTVVSFVILPMTFLASFFGMNTKFPNDLVTSQFGTVYIMCIMLFISVLVLCYLHFKKLI